jgi:peroxiredoxin
MRKLITAAILLLGLVAPAMANPDFDLGPAVGSTSPSLGSPQDSTGTPRAMTSLVGERGVVLFFFRSAAWCPFCQLQLMELNGGVAEMAKRGYSLVGVSYDTPAIQARFIANQGIKFTLLSDPKSEIIDRFKLRDPQYKPGTRAFGVPKPAIFILNREGVVKAKLYEDAYTKRPPLKLVLETLTKVSTNAN